MFYSENINILDVIYRYLNNKDTIAPGNIKYNYISSCRIITRIYALAWLYVFSIHNDTFVYSSPDVFIKCFGKRHMCMCLRSHTVPIKRSRLLDDLIRVHLVKLREQSTNEDEVLHNYICCLRDWSEFLRLKWWVFRKYIYLSDSLLSEN